MQADQILTKSDLNAFESRLEQILQDRIPKGFNPHRQWLRSKEVCQWLNISAGTLQNLRESGGIPFSRLGNTYFYPFAEIERLLNENHLQNFFS